MYIPITHPKTGEPCRTRRTATKYAPPGTSKIAKASGGYIAFRWMSDYETWRRQR